jgi:hypothetical protein
MSDYIEFQYLGDLLERNFMVTAAGRICLDYLTAICLSLMNMLKRTDPGIQPHGTPKSTLKALKDFKEHDLSLSVG